MSMDRTWLSKVRPSRWWGALGVGILLVGIGACSGLVGAGAVPAFSDFERIESESGAIELDAGDYILYASALGTQMAVRGPDGQPLELDRYDTELSQTRDGIDFDAAFTFEAPVDGRYIVLSTIGPAAVGPGVEVGKVVSGVLIGILGTLAGLVVFLVVLIRRSSSRNRVRAEEFAAARYGPGGYGGSGYGGGYGAGMPPPPPPPPGYG